MDVVLFIVGVFFLWKGSVKFSRKTEPWPKSKKTGRIIGVVLLIPVVVELMFMNSIAGVKLTDSYKVLPTGVAYVNQQHGFSIVPPTGWTIDESKKSGQIIGFVDRIKSVQAIIGVTSIDQPEIAVSNFETYVTNGIQQVQNIPEGVLIASSKITSSTVPSYLIEYKGKLDNKLLHFLQLSLLAKSGKIFVISGVVDDTLWSIFKDAIRGSLQSFSLN